MPDLKRSERGFALVASLMVLILLAMVAVAFLSLAAVQVRTSGDTKYQAEAEANARLALMLVIGELQRELGADQRVSAPVAILEKPGVVISQPHWTGVWRSTRKNGQAIIKRDDLNGGLRDTRDEDEPALTYLVSGNEGGFRVNGKLDYEPGLISLANGVRMVGPGSAGPDMKEHVIVPKVPLIDDQRVKGNYGFWIGDLGVKANLATLDPYGLTSGVEKFLPLLGATDADASGIEASGLRLEMNESEKSRVVSKRTLDLVSGGSPAWRQSTYHDVTVISKGVQANVREGGLKKNLSVFLNRNEDIPPMMKAGREILPGLSIEDNLVGPANEIAAKESGLSWEDNRHAKTSPKFGLLRDWANLAKTTTIEPQAQEARLPISEKNFQIPDVLHNSSQNLNPAALTSVDQVPLTPILVEGSMFNTFSVHLNPAGSRFRYNIRSHDFPRVVLWNPYSVPITLPETAVVLQVNGRRGFITDAWRQDTNGRETYLGTATWLSFGGRTQPDGPVVGSDAYEDSYTGSFYFSLAGETFEPGECLVFLPDRAAEYDSENVLNNTLTAAADYDFRNNYYHSASEFDEENPDDVGGMSWYPKRFWYAPSDAFFGGDGQLTQSDDSQMILKELGTSSTVSPEDFDNLRQIGAVSCSLQYGAGREPPEAWYHDVGDPNSGVQIEFLDIVDPVVTLPPDRRTRQGYRMRWFREHNSHMLISNNGLGNQPEAWEEAFIANWNLRAAYASRSPYENLIGNRGDGKSSGPWFFGIYTKDLYDESVAWRDQTPVRREGRNQGYPFGTPIEGAKNYILFDVPRADLGVVSLAQFQHAPISNFVWHPSYAIGNSLIDPRLGLEGQTGTAPVIGAGGGEKGGFAPDFIGWSDNGERGQGQEAWAEHGRAFYHDHPESENLVYDLSYEVNHTLWDEYFLSSGSDSQLRRADGSMGATALPNPRMVPRVEAEAGDLNDYHRAASSLMTDGAFNVNSPSVNAWRAVLSANRKKGERGGTPFPRVIGGERPEWETGNMLSQTSTWNATRVLTDDEIERLATAIVEEVRDRGPFLSLSDFINRRLVSGEDGKRGVIEAAIVRAGINVTLDTDSRFRLTQEGSLQDYQHPDNISDPTLIEQTQKPPSKAWGAPIYLTQADVLQAIGSSLSARSDTFVVRAYGDAVVNGQVKARAWCEAVLQRTPDPIRADESGLNPDLERDGPDFGRKFKIQSFRWLAPDEV